MGRRKVRGLGRYSPPCSVRLSSEHGARFPANRDARHKNRKRHQFRSGGPNSALRTGSTRAVLRSSANSGASVKSSPHCRGRSSALWRSNCSLCFRSGCISCGPWRDLLARRTPCRTVVYQHSTPERLSGAQAAPGKGRQGKERRASNHVRALQPPGAGTDHSGRRRRRHAVVRLASIILILILCVSLGGPILAAQPMEYRLGDRTLSYGALGCGRLRASAAP